MLTLTPNPYKVTLLTETGKSVLKPGVDESLRLALIQLLKGDKGDPGAEWVYHEHVQASASATWTINHNLGYRPSVQLFTVGGVEFEAEIVHTNLNQTIVYLNNSIAGTARLN